jgi:hypothetical protein
VLNITTSNGKINVDPKTKRTQDCNEKLHAGPLNENIPKEYAEVTTGLRLAIGKVTQT